MIHKKIGLSIALMSVVGTTVLGTQAYAQAMNGGRSEMSQRQRDTVDERKAMIQEKLTAKKEARTEKLQAKRLQVCEKRQDKINDILARGTQKNTKQLAVFQQIESNVSEFYAKKELSSSEYDGALAYVNEKEAAAVAAVEVSSEIRFDCATVDGEKPGAVVKQAMVSRHDALKEYRSAIKNLIAVVKKSLGAKDAVTEEKPSETGEQQ
jgi:hypothetical protein